MKSSNLRLPKVDGTPRCNMDLEVRNGTTLALSGGDGALQADNRHLANVQEDGTPLAWGTQNKLAGQKFTFSNLPPAGCEKAP